MCLAHPFDPGHPRATPAPGSASADRASNRLGPLVPTPQAGVSISSRGAHIKRSGHNRGIYCANVYYIWFSHQY